MSGLSQRLRFVEGLAGAGLIGVPHDVSMFEAVAAAAEKCVAKIAWKAAVKHSSVSIVQTVHLLGPPHTPSQLLTVVSNMAVEAATSVSAERMEATSQQAVQLQLLPGLKKMARSRPTAATMAEDRPTEQLEALGGAALHLHTHCLKKLHLPIGERISQVDVKPLGVVVRQAAALLHGLPSDGPVAPWLAIGAQLIQEVGLQSLWHWPLPHAELADANSTRDTCEWREVLQSLISCWRVLHAFDGRHILELMEQMKTHAVAQLNLYGSDQSHSGGLVAWAAVCVRLVEEGLVQLIRVEAVWLELLQNLVAGSELLREQVIHCVEWMVNHYGSKQEANCPSGGTRCQTLGCMRLAAELLHCSDKYGVTISLIGFRVL